VTEERKPLVLVVDDEPQMRRFLRLALSTRGYGIVEAATGNEGIQQVTAYTPDVVLLDLGLPDMDGIDIVRALREWSTMPVLIISACGQEAAKVDALDAGADDYVPKPFGASELTARIRVALRHAALMRDTTTTTVTVGKDITIDLAKRVVTKSAAEVHLTHMEYKLLVALVKHAGMVITHRQLLEQVWGPGHAEQVQYLRVYMTQLRHKLEDDPARPKRLLTELRVGYRLKLEE
jgi:two-component system KDP operon response regulator KdpE